MAKLPELYELNTTRDITDAFSGYNRNLRANKNEFYDMKNLTSSLYPILAPRGKRGIYEKPEKPHGLIAKDNLCYVDGKYVVINNYKIDMNLSDTQKTLVSMGAYIIILPDKMWLNTAPFANKGYEIPENDDEKPYGYIEAQTTTTQPVTFTLCTIDGNDLSPYTGTDEPDPDVHTMWVDQSTTPHTLRQWSKSTGTWENVATTYIKIKSANIGLKFEKYDGVTIEGLKGVELIDNTTNEAIKDTSDLSQLDGNFTIWDRGNTYIVVVGMLDVARTITNSITVKREMPKIDHIVESGNRLWGCRYGVANNGNVVNEIYASKLGDFKNWNCFMGISTDSYVASVGTDGPFTGAITHLGHPIFFKENNMHKVYGNYPADFQIQTTACRGVQKGSEKSLAIVNEVLYYKSTLAVCAYDGSLPTEVSYALGEELYSDAVACAHGNKYYITMKDKSGRYNLFVYDTAKGIWHKEDNTEITAFCSCRDELYFIDAADKFIKTVGGSGEAAEAKVEWMAETGVLGTDSPDKKYVSRMTVRMGLDIGSKVCFYLQYDSAKDWEHAGTVTGTSLRSFSVPIRPKRCDHFRLRITGEGSARIYSIAKTTEEGSDV